MAPGADNLQAVRRVSRHYEWAIRPSKEGDWEKACVSVMQQQP
jgi:hypothetical protein